MPRLPQEFPSERQRGTLQALIVGVVALVAVTAAFAVSLAGGLPS